MSASSGLAAIGVSKWYGGTRALTAVDLAIRPGRVLALIGHNGAGKSTLLRSLSGAEVPTEGSINLDGTPTAFQKPADAAAAGIACVYQELSLIGELSVAENLFLGAERMAGPVLDRRAMRQATDSLCAEYGIPASGTDLVSSLSVAQRQLLEVARAIHRNARYLLLDEPTTSLEQQQIDTLLALIRKLARERDIGVLLIDHKLDEVYAVADDIVGLANGRVVLSGDAQKVTRDHVIEAIVGAGQHAAREAMEHEGQPPRTGQAHVSVAGRKVVLEARDLAGNGLAGIDLDVHTGEIVGIYGLIGAGRSRFLRTVYGAEPLDRGSIKLLGQPFRPSGPEAAIAAGVAFLSEERKSDGLLPQMSSVTNIVVPVLGRYRRGGLLRWVAMRAAAAEVLAGVPVRGDVHAPITALSGGNQQKVLLARALLQDPVLLLLDEPTKGVDIGAKAEIYAIIRAFAGRGRAVIVVSSEEEELLEIADRIVVFREGACDGIAMDKNDVSVASLRRAAWSHAS